MALSPTHYPVVIIGSGPTGLTLANLLGRYAVRSLLVERNLTTVQEPRAVSIDDESLRTMQAAGIADEVLRCIVPGYGSHYYTPGRACFARVEPTGRPYGYPRRNAFRQPVLEQQLRDALNRFDHVETRFGWRMDRYEQDESCVVVDLLDAHDTPFRVTCDYLIGCDGAGSRVREQHGIQLEGTTFDERWLIVDLENNTNTVTHTQVFCDTRRPCITLPGPDKTRRFEFKLLPGETDAELLEPAMVDQLIRAHGADPAARLRRKVVYRFHARVAPRWRWGRIFLAGDAAHLTPPFAGQGMNSGIRDAYNLAWKLASVLTGQLGPGLLDSYEDERKDHTWQMVQLALRMGRVMSPKSRLHGFIVQSAFRSLKFWPAAADYVAQMKYKPKPRFKTGFLVAEGSNGRELVGRLLPQPEIVVAGQTRLLDEALGSGFVLLVRGDQAPSSFAQLRQPIWDRLDVVRVAVLPADVPITEPDGVRVVRETDDALAEALRPIPDCALLLRPDHYVAAIIPLADPDPVVATLEKLLTKTWGLSGQSPEPREKDEGLPSATDTKQRRAA